MSEVTVNIKQISPNAKGSWRNIRRLMDVQGDLSSNEPERIAKGMENVEKVLRDFVSVEGISFDEWISDLSIEEVGKIIGAIVGGNESGFFGQGS